MKPEMERYEWVVIRHPELASSIKNQGQEDTASPEGQNSDGNSLQQPDKPAGELSPFLSARHFNLNSKNTSMFMAGNFDSIIVGEWKIFVYVYFAFPVPFWVVSVLLPEVTVQMLMIFSYTAHVKCGNTLIMGFLMLGFNLIEHTLI